MPKSKKTKAKIFLKTKIFERDGGLCYLCGCELSLQKMTLDHVLPKAHGGSDKVDNLKLACFTCNHNKADMSLEVFKLSLTSESKEIQRLLFTRNP